MCCWGIWDRVKSICGRNATDGSTQLVERTPLPKTIISILFAMLVSLMILLRFIIYCIFSDSGTFFMCSKSPLVLQTDLGLKTMFGHHIVKRRETIILHYFHRKGTAPSHSSSETFRNQYVHWTIRGSIHNENGFGSMWNRNVWKWSKMVTILCICQTVEKMLKPLVPF